MDQRSAPGILTFVSEAGLRGFSEVDLLRAFCERLRRAGVPVARALVLIDTLHPVHEGHVFRWRREGEAFKPVTEYGRASDGGDAASKWAVSPFHHLLVSGAAEVRRRLARGETAEFPVLEELRSEGQTDYLALIHRFAEGALGEMDGVYSSWATDEPEGFAEDQLAFLRQLLPTFLGLHIGEVFYGNIGSEDRLDFTVVGPAVNEVSRIAALCRSVEKDVLISSSLGAAALPEDRGRFVSVGRYALRGVEKAQELFTLERE